MFGFVFGVVVGAVGFWAYRFWKGEDDLSWDQPFSPTDSGATSYGSTSAEPIGSSSTSGTSTSETNPPA